MMTMSGFVLEIVPERVLVLFRAGTTSLRSGLGTFFVPEPDNAKHFRYAYNTTILQTID